MHEETGGIKDGILMTQAQELRLMFEMNQGKLTLGHILNTYLAAAYRQRISDLRKDLISEGKTIKCYPNNKVKSLTEWRIEPVPGLTKFVNGQGEFVV